MGVRRTTNWRFFREGGGEGIERGRRFFFATGKGEIQQVRRSLGIDMLCYVGDPGLGLLRSGHHGLFLALLCCF